MGWGKPQWCLLLYIWKNWRSVIQKLLKVLFNVSPGFFMSWGQRSVLYTSKYTFYLAWLDSNTPAIIVLSKVEENNKPFSQQEKEKVLIIIPFTIAPLYKCPRQPRQCDSIHLLFIPMTCQTVYSFKLIFLPIQTSSFWGRLLFGTSIGYVPLHSLMWVIFQCNHIDLLPQCE